jgi:hypothetical protein
MEGNKMNKIGRVRKYVFSVGNDFSHNEITEMIFGAVDGVVEFIRNYNLQYNTGENQTKYKVRMEIIRES